MGTNNTFPNNDISRAIQGRYNLFEKNRDLFCRQKKEALPPAAAAAPGNARGNNAAAAASKTVAPATQQQQQHSTVAIKWVPYMLAWVYVAFFLYSTCSCYGPQTSEQDLINWFETFHAPSTLESKIREVYFNTSNLQGCVQLAGELQKLSTEDYDKNKKSMKHPKMLSEYPQWQSSSCAESFNSTIKAVENLRDLAEEMVAWSVVHPRGLVHVVSGVCMHHLLHGGNYVRMASFWTVFGTLAYDNQVTQFKLAELALSATWAVFQRGNATMTKSWTVVASDYAAAVVLEPLEQDAPTDMLIIFCISLFVSYVCHVIWVSRGIVREPMQCVRDMLSVLNVGGEFLGLWWIIRFYYLDSVTRWFESRRFPEDDMHLIAFTMRTFVVLVAPSFLALRKFTSEWGWFGTLVVAVQYCAMNFLVLFPVENRLFNMYQAPDIARRLLP